MREEIAICYRIEENRVSSFHPSFLSNDFHLMTSAYRRSLLTSEVEKKKLEQNFDATISAS
jgi:hypothetical protein